MRCMQGLYIVMCICAIDITTSSQLLANPTEPPKTQATSTVIPPAESINDLEAQLLPKDVAVSTCHTYACPSLKATVVAALMFSTGWVLKDLSKVVHKVDTGFDSLGEKIGNGIDIIGKKIDELKDRLDSDPVPLCPEARAHMHNMHQALQQCYTPATARQSWYIQQDTISPQPTINDDDTLLISCPAAKLHFTRMMISIGQCRDNDAWFNPSENTT